MASDSLENTTKTSGTNKDKRHVMQWWMVPKADEHGQWWWGYQKVYMRRLPDQERLKEEYLNKFKNLDDSL